MSMVLATKFAPYTDEVFKAESKTSLLTNTDFDWSGAHTVKVWKVSTVPLSDYSRNFYNTENETESISRYGHLVDLNSQVEEFILSNDKSFIFNVDRLDTDETQREVEASTALARELREVVIPTVDKYVYGVIKDGAGTTATAAALTKSNIYDSILTGSEVMDNAEVPEDGRALVVSPATYSILKQAVEFDKTDVGAELRLNGVIGMLDGMNVIKVPASRLPENFGFMIVHPSATVRAMKLEDYSIHDDTPLSSGSIVTGRICYDAFVLDNKKKGIYVHPLPAPQEEEKE